MDKKYALLKSDNFDLKIENRMHMKENSRLNTIILAQKQVLSIENYQQYTIITRITCHVCQHFQIMDAMKTKKVGLSWQVQDLSMKNERNQRMAYKASRMSTTVVKVKKILRTKNRKIKILTNNLIAIKAELATLCLHVYKTDSMLVTTISSMERILKVICNCYFIFHFVKL